MGKTAKELTKDLLGKAKDKGYDMDKIDSILTSPEGRTLMQKLEGEEGAGMRDAAERAAEGDTAALSSLLGTLMSTPEGRSVAAAAMKMKNG